MTPAMLRRLTMLIISFCFVLPSYAAPTAGRVILVVNAVNAVNSESNRQLKRRDEVFETETIVTGEDSRVQLRMVDKALLAIKPNSEVVLANYQYQGRADDRVAIKLLEGGLRTISGAVGKINHDQYRMETPIGTVGIRGTNYEIHYDPVALVMTLGVYEGIIAVEAAGCPNTVLSANTDTSFMSVSGLGVCQILVEAPATFESGYTPPSSQGQGSNPSPKEKPANSDGQSDEGGEGGEGDEGDDETSSTSSSEQAEPANSGVAETASDAFEQTFETKVVQPTELKVPEAETPVVNEGLVIRLVFPE